MTTVHINILIWIYSESYKINITPAVFLQTTVQCLLVVIIHLKLTTTFFNAVRANIILIDLGESFVNPYFLRMISVY